MLPLKIPSAAAETQCSQINTLRINKILKSHHRTLEAQEVGTEGVVGAGVQDRWDRSRGTGGKYVSGATSSPEALLKAAEWTS